MWHSIPVVWEVGKPMKIRPCLCGITEENKVSALSLVMPETLERDADVSSCDEVRIAIWVFFGGGFLVARSSSVAKELETCV
jgi:hypothetical protein